MGEIKLQVESWLIVVYVVACNTIRVGTIPAANYSFIAAYYAHSYRLLISNKSGRNTWYIVMRVSRNHATYCYKVLGVGTSQYTVKDHNLQALLLTYFFQNNGPRLIMPLVVVSWFLLPSSLNAHPSRSAYINLFWQHRVTIDSMCT